MTGSRTVEERLYEALGEPMGTQQAAALDARMEQGPSGRGSWLSSTTVRRSLLLVASLVIALPLAVAAGIVPGAEEVPPPAELEGRVTGLFADDACIDSQAAAGQIDAILADLGLSEWSVQNGTGAATAECVVPSFDAQTRIITLYMALSPQVLGALEDVREQTYRECLTREQVATLVDAAVGATGHRIESGSLSVPNDRAAEVEEHVASGCWVYSTTGWTADGTRVFWIAGP